MFNYVIALSIKSVEIFLYSKCYHSVCTYSTIRLSYASNNLKEMREVASGLRIDCLNSLKTLPINSRISIWSNFTPSVSGRKLYHRTILGAWKTRKTIKQPFCMEWIKHLWWQSFAIARLFRLFFFYFKGFSKKFF